MDPEKQPFSRDSKVTVSHLMPALLNLEDHFTHFPTGSASPAKTCYVMGIRPHVRGGVGHRDRKTNSSHHGYVNQIIAHVSHLVILKSRLGQNLLVNLHFHLAPLVNPLYSQPPGPLVHRTAGPSGDQRHLQSSALKQFDPVTILNIENLQLGPIVVVDDSPVGQNPVDVKYHHSNRSDS